jgi:Ca-activated chloride channel family protein
MEADAIGGLDSFRNGWVLLALVVPAALIAWTWSRSGRSVVLPFDHSPRVRHSRMRWVLRVAEMLPALVLAAVIVVLAGPQKWDVPRTKRALTNIQFCVDVSGSMTAKFGEGNRYDASMKAIDEFLGLRSGDAFGLTFFGSSVLHWTPLTTDASAIRCSPPFMKPGQLPPWFNGTEIGEALLACRKVLVEREQGDRMIILVTDGYSADLGGGREEEIARELKRDGIVVNTIHIAQGEIPDQVVRIAAGTGGVAFKPEDTQGLSSVFRRIDEMQRVNLEKTRAESTDDFEPWALAGLALLGALAVASFGLRYTPW